MNKLYLLLFKPMLDTVIALISTIVLSPVILGVSLALGVSNKGTPFFIQPRPGKNGEIFNLIKFKTMNDITNSDGGFLPDKERITKIGNIVRATSLDELPQLINVIKGDMSLIGPRPLLVKYLPLYNTRQKRRHLVKPGISGWAQINGRNSVSWEEKFELDNWYVDNISFKLDIKIILFTLVRVFKRDGINASETKTMTFFDGSN